MDSNIFGKTFLEMENELRRNWELVTKSDFLISISLQPNVVDLIDLTKLAV